MGSGGSTLPRRRPPHATSRVARSASISERAVGPAGLRGGGHVAACCPLDRTIPLLRRYATAASLVLCIYACCLNDERAIAGQVWASTAQIRTGDNNPRLEEQTWQARQIELGCGRDITLDWAELRRRVSMTDARLLLRRRL